jgi:type I restriction enzyme S subunit
MSEYWQHLKFADAPLDIIDGDRGKNYPKQSEFHVSGFCLFLDARNVKPDGFAFSDCHFITEQKDDLLRKGKLHREDVVMTTRGTLGNVGYFSDAILYEHVRINSGMVIFRTDRSALLPQFLYLYLRSPDFKAQVQSVRSGAAQPQLPIRDIKTLNLPLPPVRKQGDIASILSAYDDLIENNLRRIKLLEESARLLYREWFVRLRFPGHEHTRIVDGVPEGWKQGCLSDYFSTASGGTPSRKRSEFFGGEIEWVKTKELVNSFVLESEEKITEDAVQNSAAKLFPARTVLVAMYGATVGQLGILSQPSASNQACCAVIPIRDISDYIFAFLFLRHNKENLVSLSRGAAQNNVSQEIIRGFSMTMPPAKLMNVFAETLEPLFQQTLNLHQRNSLLKQVRDLLLPKLMSGEIAA